MGIVCSKPIGSLSDNLRDAAILTIGFGTGWIKNGNPERLNERLVFSGKPARYAVAGCAGTVGDMRD